jgi:hypothetical protein
MLVLLRCVAIPFPGFLCLKRHVQYKVESWLVFFSCSSVKVFLWALWFSSQAFGCVRAASFAIQLLTTRNVDLYCSPLYHFVIWCSIASQTLHLTEPGLRGCDSSFSYFLQLGRTEKIMNTLNPIFVKKFVMNYFFEEIQHLRFQVYVYFAANLRFPKLI